MKKQILVLFSAALLLSSCSTQIPKSVAYKNFYSEKPLVILLMPPINKSTNVESKEYFHSTMNIPLANSGYYVIPPFISMEILKKESAYDSELFIDKPLTEFGNVFGADLALFTIIHKWDKSALLAKVTVEIEYIIKTINTSEIIYTRRGEIIYSTSVSSGSNGMFGALADLALSAINTATTKYVNVARACNSYTLQDLPAGKYSPSFGVDGDLMSGKKRFKVRLNSQYKY